MAFLLGVGAFFVAVPVGITLEVLMKYIGRRIGISEDTPIGIVFVGMFALGSALLSSATTVSVNIEDLLGQVLEISQTDVIVSFAWPG